MATTKVQNGVNVDALLGAREALTKAPEGAKFQWRATCKWVNGTHSRSTIEGFYGLGGEFAASPVLAGDRIYMLSETGETVVLRAGPNFEIIARNSIDERCQASPAVVNDGLVIRSEQNLYFIGAK